MKRFFRVSFLITAWIFVLSEALAQSPPLAGFVFANAIGIAGNADVTANGKKVTRKGLEPGMATSGLGLPVGTYDVQVTAPGCESAKATVQLAVGATPVVVGYLERLADPRTNAVKNYIRLRQFPSVPQATKHTISAVAVDPSAQFNAIAGGQAQPLVNLKPTTIEAAGITIKDSAGVTAEVKVDEKGNYYCFVFRLADGKPGVSLVPQRIYQW